MHKLATIFFFRNKLIFYLIKYLKKAPITMYLKLNRLTPNLFFYKPINIFLYLEIIRTTIHSTLLKQIIEICLKIRDIYAAIIS